MILHRLLRFLIAALVVSGLVSVPVRVAADEVLVFAAASLKTALEQIAPQFKQETGFSVTVSYAASSVLARQIQLGAPAELFISANEDWMDVLQNEGLVDDVSRVNLLGNGLVLIGTLDRMQVGGIDGGYDLQSELGEGYLAMALVDAVPAGIYGKAALQNLGQWDTVRDQVAQTDNVRAALALVATGAAPLGIVYRSDAEVEDRVQIVGVFPAELHPPIVYPAAVTTSAQAGARRFLDYLQTDAAQAVFLEQGFTLPGG